MQTRDFKKTNAYYLCHAALTVFAFIALVPNAIAQGFENWLSNEKTFAAKKLVDNILPNGAVIASPSKQDPNYYFHWARDGALTMDSVVSLYTQSSGSADKTRYAAILATYVDFSLQNQVTINPSSAFGCQLGEPKFNTDGSAFTGPWGRPQDDGPALRAHTLIKLANMYLDSGDAEKVQFVKTKLYDGFFPTNSVIKRDLEYVSHNWQNTCFDLWEEVKGHHFYTRMVQRRSMLEGAKLATRLNDTAAAKWYNAQAAALKEEISKHWDPKQGFIVVTRDRDAGLDYKTSNLDAAVLLGVLHANASGDDFFAPTSEMVLATAAVIAAKFNGIYDINKIQKDADGGSLGIALGRYPEDRYGGNDGTTEGNAWVLCTLAMGELYARAANQWEAKGQIEVTKLNVPFFQFLNAAKFKTLSPGMLNANDQTFREIIAELQAGTDRQLRTVRYHAFPDGSLSEQMNQHTGFMQSARDLTWNYASVLTTIAQRKPAVAFSAASPLSAQLPNATFNRAGISIPDKAEARKAPGSLQQLQQRIMALEAMVNDLRSQVGDPKKANAVPK